MMIEERDKREESERGKWRKQDGEMDMDCMVKWKKDDNEKYRQEKLEQEKEQVFPPGGLRVPKVVKILHLPPTNRRPHFFTRACPPIWVLSKISEILPHFSINFDYL